jgi:hypothetical protein
MSILEAPIACNITNQNYQVRYRTNEGAKLKLLLSPCGGGLNTSAVALRVSISNPAEIYE